MSYSNYCKRKNLPLTGDLSPQIEIEDKDAGKEVSQHWVRARVQEIFSKDMAKVLTVDGRERLVCLNRTLRGIHKWGIVDNPPTWVPPKREGLGDWNDPEIKRIATQPVLPYEGEKLYGEYAHKARSLPSEIRAAVEARDKGKCASCGCYDSNTEIDHRVTRKELTEEAFKEQMQIDDFSSKIHNIDNLQTLCTKCHRIKTQKDMRHLSKKGYLKRGQVRNL